MTPPERPTGGVVPFLTIRDGRAEEAVAFYAEAFSAIEVERNPTPDGGKLMQASLKLNGGWIMLADDFPEFRGRPTAPPAATMLHLAVEDADAAWTKALAAGATVEMPIADMFWGDRYGQLRDPFGHAWSVGSPLERGPLRRG